MPGIQERGSTHVYKVNKISKEEMESMVARCVYEDPPFCNAACPLKLDTRAFLKAAAGGDFRKALQLYEKATPFPLILSMGCEAPCEAKCRLCERGDGIAVRAVEAAAARYGQLEKKAYPITVFCEQENLEDFLRCETEFLDEEAFSLELKRLKGKDIQFFFSCDLDESFFAVQREVFDVLCASEAVAKRLFPQAKMDPGLMLMETEKLVTGIGSGVMAAAFGAKKAAITVDRLAQNLDPRNMRGSEGPVESRLYTDLDEATALSRIPMSGKGYTAEEAADEAKRCIQCHCEECMKSCAYLKHYKKYPGLLSKEIYNNTQIIMGDHQLNKPMNACTLCGQCTVVCPNGFDMAHVCAVARRNMVSTDKMPLAPHEFALMDMLFSNGDAFLSRQQPGFETCRYVFFPGCQASAIAPETVKAAYLDLCERLEGGVALMLGCCGAICDWAGRYEMQDSTREFLLTELSKLGNPVIIAGCPSCRKELTESVGGEVIGIWDVLEEIGLPEGARGLERPAALHDACGARGDAHTQEIIRDLAPCCGYGGLTAYANPEVADEITKKALERSDAPYVSYCMACRDRFARQGRESRHILELVYGTDAGTPPDISEKRYNRLNLKRELLWELWREETAEMKLDFDLKYTEEAGRLMDGRMILTDDVIAVLNDYRETGEAILDSETGLMIARKRLGNATFWVKFTENGENAFTVHGAYSHRMNVVRREG